MRWKETVWKSAIAALSSFFSSNYSLQVFHRMNFLRKHLYYWFLPTACALFIAVSLYTFFFFLCPPTLRNCLTCLCRSTLSVIVTRSHRTSALTYSCCVWLRGSQTWVTFVFPRRLYKHTQEEETYPPAGFFFQLRTARARRRAVRSAVWLLLVRGSALGHLVSVVVALSWPFTRVVASNC